MDAVRSVKRTWMPSRLGPVTVTRKSRTLWCGSRSAVATVNEHRGGNLATVREIVIGRVMEVDGACRRVPTVIQDPCVVQRGDDVSPARRCGRRRDDDTQQDGDRE